MAARAIKFLETHRGFPVASSPQAGRKMLLVRALEKVGLHDFAHTGNFGPPNQAACFFAGPSHRCPPEGRPLEAAIAIATDPAIESGAVAWPGDAGGLRKYVGMTADEAAEWKKTWKFAGSAFRDYLSTLITCCFSTPADYLAGTAPKLAPSGKTKRAEVLLRKSLSSSDPSSFTPEVRLQPSAAQHLQRDNVHVAVLSAQLSAELITTLEARAINVSVLASEKPLSAGLTPRLAGESATNSARASQLKTWSLEIQSRHGI